MEPDRDRTAGPPWISETIGLAREEVTRFWATLVGFMRHPSRFCADWFARRQPALNPVGFVASALAVTGFVALVMPSGDGEASSGGLLAELAQAALPYAYYLCVGIVSHPLLRLFGSRRRLSDSVAVALFAGGGPGLVATVSAQLASLLRTWLFGYSPQLFRHLPWWAALGAGLLICVPLLGFFLILMLAMAGLHALPRWRAVAAVSLSLFLLAVALGGLHQVVRFGIGVPHMTLILHRHAVVPDVWF